MTSKCRIEHCRHCTQGRSQDAVAPAWQAEVLYREDAAILSFDAQGPEGLLAVTEQECLVFMQRGGL